MINQPFPSAALALGALYLAWDQLNSLNKETEGLGLTGIVSGMVEQGTWDPFAVVDAHQNKLAKERAARGDSNGSGRADPVDPSERISREIQESVQRSMEQVEITVKAEPGTKVETKRKSRNGSGLKLTTTGGF